MIGLGLSGLFDAGVEIANIRYGLEHRLAFDSQKETQNTMCAWVLRPHIDRHRVRAETILKKLAIFDSIGMFDFLLLHMFVLPLLVFGLGRPRLLTRIDLATALVQFSTFGRAQGLTIVIANTRINII